MAEHVALTKCFYCLEADKILLATQYRTDHKGKMVPTRDLGPANGKVLDMDPCSKCQEYMKQGVIIITIDEEKSFKDWHQPPPTNHCYSRAHFPIRCRGENNCKCNCEGCHRNWMPNPYRTGGFAVIKDEALRKVFQGENGPSLADWAIKHRWIFMEHKAAVMTGIFAEETLKE